MTQAPNSFPSENTPASASSKGERWSQILRIACHLAEHREELQSAMDGRRLAAIRASLAASGDHAFAAAEAAIIGAAVSLFLKKPWLFGRVWRAQWRRVAPVLMGFDRRKLIIVGTILAGLAVILLGVYVVRTHSYSYWKDKVLPVANEATLVQQKARIVVNKAVGVGIIPLGASVHAEGALMEINKFNASMRQLIVSSADSATLQAAFADHPEAKQVVAHDSPLIRAARKHLVLAQGELELADKVLLYGAKWQGLNPYAVLPDGLSPKWSSEAAAMSDALNSGDIAKIKQVDLQLDNIKQGGELADKASNVVASLSEDDRVIAAPYVSTVDVAVAQGDLDKAKLAMAKLTTMQQQAPISYSLYLLSIPGEKTLVIKSDAHDASIKHYYLIVQATDDHGAPVPVAIHDSELGEDISAKRFGVEVSADTFEQIRLQRQTSDGLLLVGKKSAGNVATAFALPVLDGRVSRW